MQSNTPSFDEYTHNIATQQIGLWMHILGKKKHNETKFFLICNKK